MNVKNFETNFDIDIYKVSSPIHNLNEMISIMDGVISIYENNIEELDNKLESIDENYYDKSIYESVSKNKSNSKKKQKKVLDKLEKQKEYLKNKSIKKANKEKRKPEYLDKIKKDYKKAKIEESTIELHNYLSCNQINTISNILESLSDKMDKLIINYESNKFANKDQRNKFVNEAAELKEKFDNILSKSLNSLNSNEYRIDAKLVEESIQYLKEEDLIYENLRKDFNKYYLNTITEFAKESSNGLGIIELSDAKTNAMSMRSSVLQWKTFMHENSINNSEKILATIAAQDNLIMEDYQDYIIDVDEYDFDINEGANWDLYKESKKYKKEFKDAMKRFKKANKELDYDSAKSAIQDAKNIISKIEDTMKNFKQDKSVRVWGFWGGFVRLVAKTIIMSIPGDILSTAIKRISGATFRDSMASTALPVPIVANGVSSKLLFRIGDLVSVLNNIYLINSFNTRWRSTYRNKKNKEILKLQKNNSSNLNFGLIMMDLQTLRNSLDKMEKSLKKPDSVKESSDSWLSFE